MFKTDIGEGHLMSCESVNHNYESSTIAYISDFCPFILAKIDFIDVIDNRDVIISGFAQWSFNPYQDRQFSSISFRGPPEI